MMKSLKRTIALVLTYVMVVMVLPLNAIKTSAAENLPQYLNMSDLYVNSIAQYKNKALITYGENGCSGDAILSLVTNGEERIISKLKQPENGGSNFMIIDSDKTYVIENFAEDDKITKKYYYFDYNTENLVEVNENEIIYPSNGYTYEQNYIDDVEVKNQMLAKINEKYNMEYTLYDYETGQGNANINVRKITIDNANPIYEFTAYTWTNEKSEEYYGIINDEIDLIIQGYHDYMNKYDWNSGYYLVLENSSILHLIKDGKIVNSCEVDSDFSFYNITIKEGNIVSRPYGENTYYEYEIKDGKLALVNSIPMTSNLTAISYDKDGNMWTAFDEDGKRYIAKVENGELVYKYEIAMFEYQQWGNYFQMYVHDENNIVVSSASQNKTIFIQNEAEVSPEEPKPEDDHKLPEALEGVIDTNVFTITSGIENGGNSVELTVNEDVNVQALEAQLDKLQQLNIRSLNMKGGADSIVYRFIIDEEINLTIVNSNENTFAALNEFFNKNVEDVPPVVVPPVVPPVIGDIIDEEVVKPVTGDGSKETPLQLEVKDVEAEKLEVFLNDLKDLDAVVSEVEESDEFITYYLKVKNISTTRDIALASEASEYSYIKLVVSKNNADLVKVLNTFAEANKEEIAPEEPKPEEPKPEEPKPEVPNPEVPVNPEKPNTENPNTEKPNTEKPEEDKESEDKTEALPQTGAAVGGSAVVLMSTLMIAGGAVLSFKRKEKRK